MAPHPLIHQELPYNPEYFAYNRRLAAGRMTNYSPDEVYWQVRTNVIMRHTAELAAAVISLSVTMMAAYSRMVCWFVLPKRYFGMARAMEMSSPS